MPGFPFPDDTISELDSIPINPELRLCPKFDSTSVAKFPVATPKEMGVIVEDSCAEEHIM